MKPRPILGDWYRDLESRETFFVVALDEAEQSVDIQYFDGDLEELDLESWWLRALVPIAPPEDWSGPFDDLERDDLGYTDHDRRRGAARGAPQRRSDE